MRQKVWLFVSISLLPYLATVLVLPPAAYNNSSDTFLYLDIARNIVEGRGAVVSFNVYRSWTGLFAPAWPFIHMGLPLILAVALKFIVSLRWLIALQLIPAAAALALVHRVAMKIYEDRGIASWAVLLVGVSVSMGNVVMRSMTEPWHLVALLAAVLLCLAKGEGRSRRLAAAGFLLFVAIFIRAASLVYPFAFALALFVRRGPKSERVRDALTVLTVSLGLWAIYQGILRVNFGVWAPQYPEAFRNFYEVSFGRDEGAWRTNLQEALRALYCLLRVFLVFIVLRAARVLRERSLGELLLFLLALFQGAAHLVFYRDIHIGEFGWARFVLVPVIAGFLLGLREVRDTAQRYLPRLKGFFFAGMAASVLAANVYQSFGVLGEYWRGGGAGVKGRELPIAEEWIERNSGPDSLIAMSDVALGGAWVRRPVISLPEFNRLTDIELEDFIKLHHPFLVLMEEDAPGRVIWQRAGYEKIQVDGLRSMAILRKLSP